MNNNFAPVNQQLSYTNSAPYSSVLMQKDVYKSQQNNINFSMESREEYTPYNTTNLANIVLFVIHFLTTTYVRFTG